MASEDGGSMERGLTELVKALLVNQERREEEQRRREEARIEEQRRIIILRYQGTKTVFTVVPYRNLPCTEKLILNRLHRSNPASILPWMAVTDCLRTRSAKNPLSPSPGK